MDKQIKIKRFDDYDVCDEYGQYIWTPNCDFKLNIRKAHNSLHYNIYNDGVYDGVSFKTMELADEYVRNKFAEFIKSYITIDTLKEKESKSEFDIPQLRGLKQTLLKLEISHAQRMLRFENHRHEHNKSQIENEIEKLKIKRGI